jgi:hypothetical protein
MHSLIAAGRFVHLRGIWFARPIHPRDAGPYAALARDGEGFCQPSSRPRTTRRSGSWPAPGTERQAA